MIRLYTIFIFLFTLANISVLQAQSGMLSSYEGRHFYVGFLDNEIEWAPSTEMTIYISTKFDTEVSVFQPQEGTTKVFDLVKDEIATIEVPVRYEHKQSELTHRNMLVEVTSKQPISCVGKSAIFQSGDKFSVIPTRNWGYEHFAVSMPNDYYIKRKDEDPAYIEREKTPRLGEFLIMAKENFTRVEITMAAESFSGVVKDSTFKISLNKGQSYLVKSKAMHGIKGVHDLSGSRIVSNKPVGVISGHMRSSVKQVDYYSPLGSKDHIVEMVPPTSAWSNEYITIPFGNYIKSMFKVVAKDTITLNINNELNSNSIQMLPGEVHTFDNINVPTSWVADGKFLLVQFMARYALHLNYDKYDPSMVVVPPADKMVHNTTYYASNSTFNVFNVGPVKQFLSQSIMLIADEKGYKSITVNGLNVETFLGFNEFVANGEKYYWENVPVGAEEKTVNIKADSGSFHAIAIANGYFDSYAMTVGASLFDEASLETSKPTIDFTETCSTVEGIMYDSLVSEISGVNYIVVDEVFTENMIWNLSEITDTTTIVNFDAEVVDKNRPARIKLDVYDYSGNSESYTFEYDGAQISLIDNIDYGEINAKQDSCFNFVLKTEADSVLLESIDLPADLRLKLTPILNLPKMLYKDQEYNYTLCLDNQPGNFTAVLDSMQFNFGCDYSEKVFIKADVISYNLTASNLVLPKILSGTTYNTTVNEYIEFRNAGNADIIVSELEMPTSNNFSIDTVGMFPQTLSSGGTIRFDNISFTSDVLSEHEIIVKLIDNQAINREASIKAYVGAPEINSITYDFSETRIGTNKDTTFKFQNRGSFSSEFNLVNVETNMDNDPNKTLLEGTTTINLDELAEYSLDLKYNPIEIDNFDQYQFIAKYVERWEGHDTITIQLLGQPTLPKVSTFNIDMDTIKFSDTRDSLAIVLSAFGNEDLEIKSISPLYGDEGIFEFERSFYNPRTIQKETTEELNIKFNGLQLGYHEMKLLVESDALPNYDTKLDTITIMGFVEARDTLETDMVAENLTFPSCNYDTLDLKITNTGNTIFVVNDIRPSLIGGRAKLIPQLNIDTLAINQSTTRQIEVFLSGEKQLMIDYKIDVHDINQNIDSVITFQSNVQSVQQSVSINPYDIQAVNIGEEFDLRFSGGFPHFIDTTSEVSFKINIDDSNFHLRDSRTIITFYDNNGAEVRKVDARLVNNISNIVLESDEFNSFNFDEVVSWDFELRFLALLTDDLLGDVSISINVGDCYEGNEMTTTLDVEEVCVFTYRNVIIDSKLLDISLKSNVVSNELEMLVETDGEVGSSIYIMDMNGKKYYVFNKLMFDKGKNNIILNLSDYANGKYILIIDSQSSISKQEFIITK